MNSLKKFGFDTQREPKCFWFFFYLFDFHISSISKVVVGFFVRLLWHKKSSKILLLIANMEGLLSVLNAIFFSFLSSS